MFDLVSIRETVIFLDLTPQGPDRLCELGDQLFCGRGLAGAKCNDALAIGCLDVQVSARRLAT